MAKSKSSKQWLQEHFSDKYVKNSQQQGYRARSAYKLIEIIDKYDLLNGVYSVVDLGAAPGGWCQVVKEKSSNDLTIVGLDLLPIEAIEGVHFIQGDFTDDEVYQSLLNVLKGDKINLVLSDMAPNLSGVSATDQPKSMYLAELALDFCRQSLEPGGSHVVKLFQGEGFDGHIQALRQSFQRVVIIKPDSSRSRSREVFAVSMGFKES
ncbi:RlmE family RNA methyltransferase [Marinicella gelatinilytica]|uniref:RlmE family RNA methyltransferase n=1 Tax=Marinicella gelatinilytica TaxID=2996017 RepID=UPI002260BB2A|nr:SAM-dependent methyltransferase [Marinicella gelatinilytica]MCX7544354.1 23S rRNA methyltransferase [Marinicella gelatinilytica]